MNQPALLLFAALFLIHSIGWTNEHPHTADTTQNRRANDSAITNVDTTLRIATMKEGDLTIYTINRYKTVVVRIPRISSYMLFREQSRSLARIGQDSNFTLVMNASFFDNSTSIGFTGLVTTYRHAGYLKIGNTQYEDLKADRQLSQLLAYDSRRNRAEYFDVTDLDKTSSYDLVVQTGPMIVRKSRLDTTAIRRSINGFRSTPRTMFASVNGEELYVIVTKSSVTLPQIGTMLLSSGIFGKELDVIDFDGGPSTSMYIKNHPELSVSPDNRMPVVLGVR